MLRLQLDAKLRANLLKALAHPFRLQLLEELAHEEECVCHLSVQFGKPQPYVSQQLAELRDADLLLDRKEAQRTFYRLADERVVTLLQAVRDVAGMPPLKRRGSREPVPSCTCPKCNPGGSSI